MGSRELHADAVTHLVVPGLLGARLEEVAGQVTGKPDLEDAGKDENMAGKIQNKIGEIKKVFGK